MLHQHLLIGRLFYDLNCFYLQSVDLSSSFVFFGLYCFQHRYTIQICTHVFMFKSIIDTQYSDQYVAVLSSCSQKNAHIIHTSHWYLANDNNKYIFIEEWQCDDLLQDEFAQNIINNLAKVMRREAGREGGVIYSTSMSTFLTDFTFYQSIHVVMICLCIAISR